MSKSDPTASRDLLRRAAEHAMGFLDSVGHRPVGRPVPVQSLRAALAEPLPEEPRDPAAVLDRLVAAVDPGIVASAGPRYFGFVVGGALPIALAVDWLTSTWDQNAGLYALSPAASAVEEVTASWLADLFGLPAGVSAGYSTGATMASFTAIAAARHALLERQGWDVERQGLFGAPELPVVVGDEAHVTILVSLQMLGLGRDRVHRVAADDQGRMRPDALREALRAIGRPALICAQSGNVNSGAFDPLEPIAEAVREREGWLHVDGAFGLWAKASPTRARLLAGVERADSWTTDAHKWLNVPYDSGVVLCAHPKAHQAAMTLGAAYYVESEGAERDPYNWVAESSRRARGFDVYAALAALGRRGVGALVDRCCDLASRFAEGLRAIPGARVMNEVVLNQVVVRFEDPSGERALGDARTRAVVAAIQADGTCWASGTTWRDHAAMRISVSSWSTTEADVDLSLAAMRRAAEGCPRG